MRRREFIAGLGSAAATWPLAARAQQPKMPVVGILHMISPDSSYTGLDAIREGMGELGYVEGGNVTLEYRWGENHPDRLLALADDLVRRQVAVIVALGGDPSARAAKRATATIPIVFAAPRNPVNNGLVASLNRPGGNLTGMTSFGDEVITKRLQFLHELVPSAATIAFLTTTTGREFEVLIAQPAANALGLQLPIVYADTEREVESAFANFAQMRAGAVLVNNSAFYLNWRHLLVALAARYEIPASFHRREFVTIGGLSSYGPDLDDTYRQAGRYVGRILKGEKPADLPVMQPTKIDLAINLKTAKALGLTVPSTLLVSADEVIE